MKKQSKIRPAGSPQRTQNPEKKPRRARILLVEDNDATRHSLQKLLAARNFEVRTAATVEDAWALVADSEFDVLISDIGLPDGDGFLLMHELKDRFGISGIALTGFDLEDDFKLSKEAGFSVHLTKPVDVSVLDEALASLGI
jgi:DNA-binding response OmpR family regulator